MDLFKRHTMKIADSLDWNCKRIVKRTKGDTRIIHKKARRLLRKQSQEEAKQYCENNEE